MTDINNEDQISTLNEEIERLRQKNAELLNESKKAKARTSELESALQAANGKLMDLELNKPVEAMLKDLFIVSPRLARMELEEHYQFVLGEDGKIQMQDKQGKPVEVQLDNEETIRPAQFTPKDIESALVKSGKFNSILIGSRASGGGASGVKSGSGYTPKSAPATEPKPASPFGLR